MACTIENKSDLENAIIFGTHQAFPKVEVTRDSVLRDDQPAGLGLDDLAVQGYVVNIEHGLRKIGCRVDAPTIPSEQQACHSVGDVVDLIAKRMAF